MPVDIGRISGGMLKDNLLRDGVDLSFETDLLYFDVGTNRLGIKNTAPNTEIEVTGTTRSTNTLSTDFSNGDITVDFSRITTALGALNITAVNRVEATAIATADININNNVISTSSDILLDIIDGGTLSVIQTSILDLGLSSTTVFDEIVDLGDAALAAGASNTSLEIRPNGSGTLEVYNEFNITGSLHATGDITLDGTITFGNNADDSVDFNADIASDIVPDTDAVYKLGTSSSNRWNGLYTNLLNGQSVTTSILSTPSGVTYSLRPGNIWFVATNGDNTNQGDHENGPFATIEKALSVAVPGDTVKIYPGTYTELFPLVVPAGVTVNGLELRSVTIIPDTASQSEDVFHLNGETSVTNLTIKDFYYDSINDKGYAFRFAPNARVTTRSPYIQNITVITHGSSTSPADPRGFDSADAGKGALVDGADTNYLSEEAAMLFHAVTFITPGVDGLTMTNGVRVEWLNSFTYFADRAIYATQGTGRLTKDGSTLAYGAEIRSIGSANVYGNYGAVADGADTLMYLIQHNFGYIGAGKDSSNDSTLVIQTNETVELNSGRVYYQSQDHTGTFRVGDLFYVDFENGTVSFDASSLASTGATGLTITTGLDVTAITKDFVTTGNLKIAGNTIESLSGAVNILASSGETNLTLDVNVAKDLDVTGDFSLSGQLILGNQTADTVTFGQTLNQNFEPDVTETYNLGSASKVWKDTYTSEANVNDIRIRGNVIETTATDTDLILQSAPLITTTAWSAPTDFPGYSGAYNGSGCVLNGGGSVTGRVSIKLTDAGKIATWLALPAGTQVSVTGTGVIDTNPGWNFGDPVILPLTGVSGQDGLFYYQEFNAPGVVYQDGTSSINSVSFTMITAGSSKIYTPTNDVLINHALTVGGLTTVQSVNIIGSMTHVGPTSLLGNKSNTGFLDISGTLTAGSSAFFDNVQIVNNRIFTSDSNADLQLSANGSGIIDIAVDNVSMGQSLTAAGDFYTTNITASNRYTAEEFYDADILIKDNYIATTNSNSNLELRGNSVGGVFLESTKFTSNVISNADNIVIQPNTAKNVKFDTTSAVVLPKGTTADRPTFQQGDLRFNTGTNIFEGFGAAFGGVYSLDRLTSVTAGTTENLNFRADNILSMDITSARIRLNGLLVDNTLFDTNTVTTTNNNLTFAPNGTGLNKIENITFDAENIQNDLNTVITVAGTGRGYVTIASTTAFVIPYGNNSQRPAGAEIGATRFNVEEGYIEVYDGTVWNNSAGVGDTVTAEFMEDTSYLWNLILG